MTKIIKNKTQRVNLQLIFDGYIYYNQKNMDTATYNCRKCLTKSCKGKLFLNLNNDSITPDKLATSHNLCEKNENQIKALFIKSEIKSISGSEPRANYIFEKTISKLNISERSELSKSQSFQRNIRNAKKKIEELTFSDNYDIPEDYKKLFSNSNLLFFDSGMQDPKRMMSFLILSFILIFHILKLGL